MGSPYLSIFHDFEKKKMAKKNRKVEDPYCGILQKILAAIILLWIGSVLYSLSTLSNELNANRAH